MGTTGCASGQPPRALGNESGAVGWPGGSFQAALCTCSHTLCSRSSSASVHGTSGAEYRKREVATMLMAGTI